jgi:hypothetical protein
MKTFHAAAALFVFALAAVPSAQAQTSWELGPYAGYNLDNEEFLIGAVSRIHLATAPVTLNPGFEFYPSIGGAGVDASLIVLNFDVQYQLEAETVEPYIGGGLFWRRTSVDVTVGGLPVSVSDSDMGINLKGGFMFGTAGSMRPFAEGVIALGNGESFMLKGGFLFPIG